LLSKWFVDFSAEVANVNLDNVQISLRGDSPHGIEELLFRQDFAWSSHEELQECAMRTK